MDKNTRYFHNIASARRRNNRIDALMIHGRLVHNQVRIKGAIREFYKELYRQDYVPRIGVRDGLVKNIQRDEADALEVMPSAEEIREAVWDSESSKAPGSDGYNMNFIKKCNFEGVGEKDASCHAGVGRKDSAVFVKGRKIHDGALIACETVHWLKTRKKTAAIIKLDFQKAYDKVRWSFVDVVLQKMGFSQRRRIWVKECYYGYYGSPGEWVTIQAIQDGEGT
ncbi:uncharacterized protein [Arachis hypogaea]|uniref:uncharacterized protein n=1 Tax=Arachis hypogaea TaxID=3818 RepID=UPI003B21E3B6